MHRTSSTQRIFLTLGSGLALAACGDSNVPVPPVTYTWTEVSTDMRTYCAISTACHGLGTKQPFVYDLGLVAGSDVDNYNVVMNAKLVDTTAPASSPLIVVGKGGMYQGMTHNSSLSGTVAILWNNWISAGATFP